MKYLIIEQVRTDWPEDGVEPRVDLSIVATAEGDDYRAAAREYRAAVHKAGKNTTIIMVKAEMVVASASMAM